MPASHNNFQYQKYQYILVRTQLVQFTEGLVPGDSLVQRRAVDFTESLVLSDSTSSYLRYPPIESGVINDSFFQKITLDFTEGLVLSDKIAQAHLETFTEGLVVSDKIFDYINFPPRESAVISDGFLQDITLKFTEGLIISEASSVVPSIPTQNVDFTESLVGSDSYSFKVFKEYTESVVPGDILSASSSEVTFPDVGTVLPHVWRGGLRPFHNDMVSRESGGHHQSFYYPGTYQPLAYSSLTHLGSSTFHQQGYQAITVVVTVVTSTFTESLVVSDSRIEDVTLKATESLVVSESIQFSEEAFLESSVIQDTLSVKVIKQYNESVVVSDKILPARLVSFTE